LPVGHLCPILGIGRCRHQREQVPKRIDRDVDLAPLAPLGTVVAAVRTALGQAQQGCGIIP